MTLALEQNLHGGAPQRGFSRSDTSVLGRWWWTVDRWSLGALLGLMVVGVLLSFAASPPVAERMGADTYHFITRHLLFLPISLALVLGLSLMSPRGVLRVGVIGFLVALVLTAATVLLDNPINGARRWLFLGSFSLQPSEMLKPTFAVACAWVLTAWRDDDNPLAVVLALGLLGLAMGLLILQPDLGQTGLIFLIWFAQMFLAGIPFLLVLVLILSGVALVTGAYFLLPHVADRIDRFVDPASGDNYQVLTAMRAFRDGGLFGVGPGEGRLKEVLPDAHTDFIFAVTGEEFGFTVCLLLVLGFAVVVFQGCRRLLHEDNLFVLLAASGLLVQFGMQAVINMASTVALMPTKGMTLPFVSYGGSSMIGLGLTMGMLLALTRRRPANTPLPAGRIA